MTAAYDWKPERIAEYLNRLTMVGWDRAVQTEIPGDGGMHNLTVVYGWIPREDGGFDFVTLDFATWAELPGFVTSSKRYSREMFALLYGSPDAHNDCVPVTSLPFGRLLQRKAAWRR